MGLITDCITGFEIHYNYTFKQLSSHLFDEVGDAYLGDFNLFQSLLQDVNQIMNFQIETFTMSLIQTKHIICINISNFRRDFKIEKLFRIKNTGKKRCYVIVSNLKPYWITSSLNNFLNGWKKIKLFDGENNGSFIWVRLTKYK